MLLHRFPRAHFSAASSSIAPTRRLRALSSTTSPFTSALRSTSSSGVVLTWTPPANPLSRKSPTKHAASLSLNTSLSRPFISFTAVGYPSCPASSAIFSASVKRDRRTATSFAIIFQLPSAQPRLHGLAFQLPQRIRRDPPGSARLFFLQPPRRGYCRAIQSPVPLADVAQRPVHRFTHKIAFIPGFPLDHFQKLQILSITCGSISISKIRRQSEPCPLLELSLAFCPRERLRPRVFGKDEQVTACSVATVPVVEIADPQLH